jgi:hypothetical protein
MPVNVVFSVVHCFSLRWDLDYGFDGAWLFSVTGMTRLAWQWSLWALGNVGQMIGWDEGLYNESFRSI